MIIGVPTYVYPNAAIDNGIKLRFLRGLLSVPTTTGPDDWSMVCSAGPLNLASGGDVTVAFAMVHGATLEEFLDNVDAAQAAYSPSTPVTEDLPVKMFRLDQNAPNPFNPQTTVSFEVSAPGPVRIRIHDLRHSAASLMIDFAGIETGVARGAPADMGWFAAFGLLTTLVWLYLEPPARRRRETPALSGD